MNPAGRDGALAKFTRVLPTLPLTLWFLGCAAYFAATTANVLTLYALRQPTFDQYKEYAHYLSQPFLTSVFMLENGHRPVFPALIANIEIATMGANQLLQLGIGCLCIALALGVVATVAWRHAMPLVARAAAVMLSVLGLLWLANARMLVQGVGELQIYLVVASVLLAALATWAATQTGSWRAMAAATIACVVAMFTFGAGAAAFPSVLALGTLLRLRWRLLAIPACAWAVCLVLYIVVLPGHEGVQHSLALRPFDSAMTAARWLSSPWANAFFGLADPPVQAWLPDALRAGDTLSRTTASAADSLVSWMGAPWPSISTAFGVIGILAFLVRTLLRYLRRAAPSRYETIANALCIFGLLTAAVIGLGRVNYFDAFPYQIFADRYLAWPCLFWTGLALLVLDDACRSSNRAAIVFVLAGCAVLPLILLPTHGAWADWAAAMYRSAERSAAAARSDVFDPDVYPNDADASRDNVLSTLAAMKARHLGMFADPGWELAQTTAAPSVDDARVVMDAHVVATFQDPISALPAARVEGVVRQGMKALAHGQLAVVDDADRIVGLVQFSFVDGDSHIMQLHHPSLHGFDAYIRDYRADRHYRIVAVESVLHRIVAQAPIAPAS